MSNRTHVVWLLCASFGCNLFSQTPESVVPDAAQPDVGDMRTPDIGSSMDVGIPRDTSSLPDLDERADLVEMPDLPDLSDAVDLPDVADLPDAPDMPTPKPTVRVDFGDGPPPSDANWTTLSDFTAGVAQDVVDTTGLPTDIDVAISIAFQGINSSGLANGLGWPVEVSSDSFFCGSFDSHTEGLLAPGQFTISGLIPGADYELRLFSSREGNDGGLGRLTRYTVDGLSVDFDASDNTDQTVDFVTAASGAGEIVVDVAVSPDGTSRFCYIGALELTQLQR